MTESENIREQMIKDIQNNDLTALERYSRWLIFPAYLKGYFKNVNDEMQYRLEILMDSCRESL